MNYILHLSEPKLNKFAEGPLLETSRAHSVTAATKVMAGSKRVKAVKFEETS